jgi:hypothetical protein
MRRRSEGGGESGVNAQDGPKRRVYGGSAGAENQIGNACGNGHEGAPCRSYKSVIAVLGILRIEE